MEWDRRLGRWRPMHRDELIVEACLEPALPVRALLESAAGDEAVLGAIGVRRPDLVARLEAKAEARGEVRGEALALDASRRAVRALCANLGVAVTAERERAIASASADELVALVAAIASGRWASE